MNRCTRFCTRSCTRYFAALAVLMLGLAFTATPAAALQEGGYTGIITQERVDVRSGAGRAYYVVGELEAGQHVHVVDVLFDGTWFKVTVPSGIHSYVSKAFINAEGDGSTGVVNADRTEFKAASLRGPGESYRVQGTFSEGDRVQIVGEEGNFYKIIAPSNAFVFIAEGTLRRATAEDMRPAQPEQTPQTTPEPEAAPQDPEIPAKPDAPEATPDTPDTVETPQAPDSPQATDETDPQPQAGTDEVMPDDAAEQTPGSTDDAGDQTDTVTQPDTPADQDTADDEATQAQPQDDAPTQDSTDTEPTETEGDETEQGGLPALPDVEVTTPARSDALKQRELELLPYFHTPIEERPLDHMESGYREILVSADLPEIDQRIVEVRLRTIARQREILAAMDRVAAAREVREPRIQVPDVRSLPRAPVTYEAIGTLHVSSVYDGRSLPRMYRLVDASGRTVAYVAPTPLIDESDLVQSLVGVVGSSSYDPALKLQIITPTRLDALAAQSE